jgi:uncharacterized membrane protein
MTNDSKKYFGDSPKAAKIYARKYFPTADISEQDSSAGIRANNFPAAQELAEYEAVVEGGADRVLKLLEREQNQRHKWESKALKMQNLGRRFGQAMFALMIIFITYSVLTLAQSGHILNASLLTLVGFSGLAAALFFANKQRFNVEKRHYFTNRYNNKYRGR